MACPTWLDISTFLVGAVGPLVLRGASALGVGYVTFEGIDVLLEDVMQNLDAGVGATNVSIAQVLHAFGLDQAASIFCSAISARLAWLGASSGVVSRFVTFGPPQ